MANPMIAHLNEEKREWLDFTNFNCYSSDTEILTDDGFKYFEELKGDCKIATLDSKGELEYQQPIEIQKYPYHGKMIHIGGKGYDFLVTPNHLMLARTYKHETWELVTAREIYQGHRNIKSYEEFLRLREQGLGWRRISKRIPEIKGKVIHWCLGSKPTNYWICVRGLEFKCDANWGGNDPSYFTLPALEQVGKWKHQHPELKIPIGLWLEFLGWWLAEGHLYNKNSIYRVHITQNEKLGEIFNLTKEIGQIANFKPRSRPPVKRPGRWGKSGEIVFSSKQFVEYLKQFGKSNSKFIPKEIKELSKQKLRILLDTLIKGDGHCYGSSSSYTTASKRLADDVCEVGFKCGYRINVNKRKGTYIVYLSSRHNTPLLWKKPVEEEYDGYVYCVTVLNHVILTRRKGKIAWCGNSWSVLKLVEGGKDHIREMIGVFKGSSSTLEITVNNLVRWGLLSENRGKKWPFRRTLTLTKDGVKMLGLMDEIGNMVKEIRMRGAHEVAQEEMPKVRV